MCTTITNNTVTYTVDQGQQTTSPPHQSTASVPIPDERHEDAVEAATITKFLAEGCKCEHDCYTLFPRSHYEKNRNICAELPREMLDMLIVGKLEALTPLDGKETLYMHRKKKVN